MLGTLFVQYWICVVDVDDYTLGLSETKRPLQHAALAPEGKMAHIASRPVAAFGGYEFVVLPEGAIEESQIAFIHGALPVFSESRDTGSVEESFFPMDEMQADDRFLRGQTTFQRIAHVVRKTTEKRHSLAEEAVFCSGRRGRNERNETIERQGVQPRARSRSRQ